MEGKEHIYIMDIVMVKRWSFKDWCWDNDVHDMFGIVKHYKNKKTRYKPIDWDDLANFKNS